ncbi:unnamed protein product [Parascedosporium putredinis]|uniref:DUF676 domain-containing protein n=1 Tax=Parascedosporium putredinis TaxID=1442378 RepID=A0A9P1H339_9PEZI|nr:unnamed protein product [Parascedosporium putredinis]CAI7995399.1 unnamed protein product [Parascedosporium putredinis]
MALHLHLHPRLCPWQRHVSRTLPSSQLPLRAYSSAHAHTIPALRPPPEAGAPPCALFSPSTQPPDATVFHVAALQAPGPRNLGRELLDEFSELKKEYVNIVAHSMGGLDARYMLSCLAPSNVRVASLVTIATPHRGSIIADRVLDGLGGERGLERATRLLGRVGLEMTGVEQLTRRYMSEEFNPIPPSLMNPFRWSFDLLREEEGPNDGLVSVESSRWGTYEGTLMDVSHLDLINWSNNIAWTVKGWMGMERRFNAIAFYLGIADMLAKEGL